LKVCHHIFAMLGAGLGGGSAECQVVRRRAAARIPAHMLAHDSAALPLAGLTALQALRYLGQVTACKRVLMVGVLSAGGTLRCSLPKAAACG
jgi:NADPH:quinone reductase-like Zn-dependent oxidoreductase